jgi:opacity protein-like surface antigen
MYNGLFNAIWSPLGSANWHGLTPYLGAGVGFSHIDESISGIGGVGFGTTSQNETDFAANGILGVDFAVMPQLTIGARYRLLYVNTSSTDNGVSTGDFIGHVITANATWHF